MALFGSRRDMQFMTSINKELIQKLVDTEVEFYKLNVATTDFNSNIYGESTAKHYYSPILIHAYIERDNEEISNTELGVVTITPIKFRFLRSILEEVGIFPEIDDVVKYDGDYFKLNEVIENQLVVGKNPTVWPGGNTHGMNLSIIASAHLTSLGNANIEKIHFGEPNKEPKYKLYD